MNRYVIYDSVKNTFHRFIYLYLCVFKFLEFISLARTNIYRHFKPDVWRWHFVLRGLLNEETRELTRTHRITLNSLQLLTLTSRHFDSCKTLIDHDTLRSYTSIFPDCNLGNNRRQHLLFCIFTTCIRVCRYEKKNYKQCQSIINRYCPMFIRTNSRTLYCFLESETLSSVHRLILVFRMNRRTAMN